MKVFMLLIRLAPPKEDLQEVLPFIVTKAIILTIEEKMSEKITLLLQNESLEICHFKISSFVFKAINGVSLK